MEAVGLSLAGLGVATTAADAGSQLTPRAESVSSNVSADVAGIGLGVVQNSQSAPPDPGAPEVGALASFDLPTLLSLGALTTVNEANWGLDTACVTDGVLSQANTETLGIDLLPLIAGGILELGVSETTSQTSLVNNSGLNYGVTSNASGTVSQIGLLGGAVTVDVLGTTSLTATATGTSTGTVEYTPATVTVNLPGGPQILTYADPTATVTIGLATATVTLNQPPTGTVTATSASASTSLLTIDVEVLDPLPLLPPVADVSVDILPLQASATAPVGGIDCPPAAPIIVTPAEGATTGPLPAITGTAFPNATVQVIVDGTSIGTTTADGGGNWSITPTTPLANGPHAATAIQTVAGQSSPSSPPRNFIVDAVAPAPPVILTPADGTTTADNTPAVTGTAEPNSTVTVSFDGTVAGTTTADGSGNWTFLPDTPLSDGPHTAVATATDAAGNVSGPSNTVNFTVDTTAPAAPVVVTPADGSSTNDTTPLVTGTAAPNTTVTVFMDGTSIGTTPADGSGNWSMTSPVLSEGSHTVRATSTDAVGNVSPSSPTNTFVVDTTAPVAPVILTPVTGTVTSDNTPTITGTAEANSTVTVRIDGSPAGTTIADGSGNWTFTTGILLDGPHTAVATSADAAGNVSIDSNTVGFTVDTLAPVAPVIQTPITGTITDDNTPLISGTAEANSTVTVIIDGTPAGTTTADGSGNWTLTPAALADGPHSAVATSTDAAGNVSVPSNTVTFTVDTAAPLAPVVITPANGSLTNDTTPLVTGTAEANSTVEVFIDDVSVGTTPADGSGNWSLTPPVLTEGTHTVRATSTDAAGNTSVDSNTNTFTVDSIAPAAPVLVTPADGSVTSDNTPSVTGTAEPLSTVTVRIDGSVAGTTTADALGNWTFTTGILLDGPHTAVATATDAAGNVSADSNTNTFTVDTLDPASPVILTPANGSATNDNTPAITGTAEANSTVTVTIDGTVAGSTTTDGSGNWTFTPTTPLTDGSHTAVATATDAAGNESGPSNTVTFTVDTVAPAAPVITSPTNGSTTTDSTPPITGTAEPGSTVTVIVDGTPIGTAPTDGNGNWTITPTTPLSNGQHTITATATDAADNTGPASAPVVFTIAAAGGGGAGAGLPATGGAIPWPALLIGSLLIAFGAVAVTLRRRRVA